MLTTDQTTRIEYLDPAALLVDKNVRADLRLTADFVSSIRDHGVLMPIVARREPDGIRVLFGHRRTAAAVEAGRAMVPVVVTDPDDSDATAAQINRILTQHAENTDRAGLSNAEHVAVVEQLAAFGLPAAEITRRTRIGRRTVQAALTTAASATATTAIQERDYLDLEQAAVLAEFDNDDNAIDTLLTAAQRGRGFAFTAQRLRQDRADRTARDEALQELTAAGATIIDPPRYGEPTTDLSHLRAADRSTLTEDNHQDCPGHAAYVAIDHEYDDSDQEDKEIKDENEDQNPTPRSVAHVRYACTNPAAYGHLGGNYARRGQATSDKKTDEEREAATIERRRVIENNKAWLAAEVVRREWLTSFLTRRSAPKGTAPFVGMALGCADHEVRRGMESGHRLAKQLLGINDKGAGTTPITAMFATTTDSHAAMIMLGLVLAAYEDTTGKHSWRNPTTAAQRYFQFLIDNGYDASPVEQLVISTPATW